MLSRELTRSGHAACLPEARPCVTSWALQTATKCSPPSVSTTSPDPGMGDIHTAPEGESRVHSQLNWGQFPLGHGPKYVTCSSWAAKGHQVLATKCSSKGQSLVRPKAKALNAQWLARVLMCASLPDQHTHQDACRQPSLHACAPCVRTAPRRCGQACPGATSPCTLSPCGSRGSRAHR